MVGVSFRNKVGGWGKTHQKKQGFRNIDRGEPNDQKIGGFRNMLKGRGEAEKESSYKTRERESNRTAPPQP